MGKAFDVKAHYCLRHVRENHVHCFCGAQLPPFDEEAVRAEVICPSCGQTYRLELQVQFLANDIWKMVVEDGRWVAKRRESAPSLLGTDTTFIVEKEDGTHYALFVHRGCSAQHAGLGVGAAPAMTLVTDRSREESMSKRQITAIYTCRICGETRVRKLPKKYDVEPWLKWLKRQEAAAQAKTQHT